MKHETDNNAIKEMMEALEEEVKKSEEPDYLTGLLNRKVGESKITNAMKEQSGCLAFVDVDNLKRTNDTMGHLAGDYVLKTVGEVLSECGKKAIISRVGGDEFLFYMIGADKGEATKTIEAVLQIFAKRREENKYLGMSSLSAGLCLCTPADTYADIFQKADKALYHVKQSGKCGYYFHTSGGSGTKKQSSVDLKKLVANLADYGSYEGTLSVEYRDFAKIYDFIRHLVERYDYNMQLIMVTLEITNEDYFYIDEKEYAMTCLERTIQASLRSVDVCTRFSGEQFLIAFFNAKKEDIVMITNRIFEKFYNVYDKKSITLSYDIAEMPGKENKEV
ncbi:MAG: diguanylate cyclase [Lachnospiraceae bacterium]|nr:diguanylate cyclase [Lachnospiraceae bacterium]